MSTTVFTKLGFQLIGAVVGAGIGVLLANYFFKEEKEMYFVNGKEVSKEEYETRYTIDGKEVSKEEYEIWVAGLGWNPNMPEKYFDDLRKEEKDPRGEYIEKILEEPIPMDEKSLKRKEKAVKPIDYTGISMKGHKVQPPIEKVAKDLLGGDAIKMSEEENSPEEEMEQNPDIPHVISFEEYVAGSRQGPYDQQTLTYYETDDTLADSDNEIILKPELLLGNTADLLEFGKDSNGDPDVVYIRNKTRIMDYEVVRVHKAYTEAVLGIVQPKQKPRRTRKVRPDNNENEEG